MRTHKDALEIIASDLLEQNAYAEGDENKPNYSNRDFFNAVIIFQTALMDKVWDNMDFDGMGKEDREKMAVTCGEELRKLIFTFTGLDTHKLDLFL